MGDGQVEFVGSVTQGAQLPEQLSAWDAPAIERTGLDQPLDQHPREASATTEIGEVRERPAASSGLQLCQAIGPKSQNVIETEPNAAAVECAAGCTVSNIDGQD